MERYNRFIAFDAEWIVFGNLPEVFCKKDVFKIFAKSTGKHLCRSLRPATPARDFSCKFCKIFKIFFFMEHLQWLLLDRVWLSVWCARSLNSSSHLI